MLVQQQWGSSVAFRQSSVLECPEPDIGGWQSQADAANEVLSCEESR